MTDKPNVNPKAEEISARLVSLIESLDTSDNRYEIECDIYQHVRRLVSMAFHKYYYTGFSEVKDDLISDITADLMLRFLNPEKSKNIKSHFSYTVAAVRFNISGYLKKKYRDYKLSCNLDVVLSGLNREDRMVDLMSYIKFPTTPSEEYEMEEFYANILRDIREELQSFPQTRRVWRSLMFPVLSSLSAHRSSDPFVVLKGSSSYGLLIAISDSMKNRIRELRQPSYTHVRFGK